VVPTSIEATTFRFFICPPFSLDLVYVPLLPGYHIVRDLPFWILYIV
jgi:hypothetical protein